MATNLPMASALGIVADGTTDQTSALSTIFSNAAYTGLILDCPPIAGVNKGILISTALNCQGKKLVFAPGNYFTGVATISNAVIEAGFRQKCFDINSAGTINISLATCSYSADKFSAMWYGTVPGTADSSYGLQKSIDTIVANQTTMRTLFFPSGTYLINGPLVVYSWGGTSYGQPTMRLEGESPFWERSGTGTVIQCNSFKNSFALGIQQGKGVEVSHIKFIGNFTPPALTNYQFFTCAFGAYTDGSSRDTQFSPYSGIVIDPFAYSTPSDGGYPSIVSYNGTVNFYRGSGSGGSTGCTFEDVFITNFVCGFITSPSGFTFNAELLKINKIQIENCKAGIVGTQDQEKLNKVEHLACWGGTHTLLLIPGLAGQLYGIGRAGHWVIDGVNVAGAVNRLVARQANGFFPMSLKNVYAESLGSIGTWSDSQAGSLQDSSIDFVNFSVFGAYPAGSHFNSSGVTIRNCSLRYYDGVLEPLYFINGIFEDCAFSNLPYGGVLINCFCGPWGDGITGQNTVVNPLVDQINHKQSASRYFAGGRGKYIDSDQLNQGKQLSLIATEPANGETLRIDSQTNAVSTVSITGNTATVTPPTVADLASVFVGRLAINVDSSQLMGLVTSIGASTYTISYVLDGIVSGTHVMGQWHPIYNISFMGTITTGSNLITGVVQDFGSITELISVGGFIKIPGFYSFRAYSQQARVVSYNSGTATITMDRKATHSATNYYFSSNGAVKNISTDSDSSGSGSGIPATEIFPKGSEWFDNVPNYGRRKFIITGTGYFSGTPQATWTELT